jgi:1-acyl-sn-glycerol-3-phosphate acyltransferase
LSLFIERNPDRREATRWRPRQALQRGESLIIFPKARATRRALPSEFKVDYATLRQKCRGGLVPVYLDNLYRACPRGTLLRCR